MYHNIDLPNGTGKLLRSLGSGLVGRLEFR